MRRIRSLALGAAALVGGAGVQPATAVTFRLHDLGGAAEGTLAREGFDIATDYWSSVLTSSSVVDLDIGFSSLGPNILGQTGSNQAIVFDQDAYAALAAHATDALDFKATGHLPGLATPGEDGVGALSAVVNQFADPKTRTGYTSTATRIDNDGTGNNEVLAINTANAKAIGITSDLAGTAFAGADGSVKFSSDFSFDFNPTNGISLDSFDFIGVAIHEIGHALGFVSGVDAYDFYSGPNGPGDPAGLFQGNLEEYAVATPLDLFRYSAAGTLDWSTGGSRYLSADGGATKLLGVGDLSTGEYNGDGHQASHWLESPKGRSQIGVMDPTSGYGQLQEVTAADIGAFDMIGYKTAFDPSVNTNYRVTTADIYRMFGSVPEPASWATMVLGFGLVGLSGRRRRSSPQQA